MTTSSKKLTGYVTFTPEGGGISQTFGPDDELPDWAAKQIKPEHTAEVSSDVDDLPVPGPGQVPGEGMSDEEKDEARKKAERERKAAQRAAVKTKAENDAAALKAAEDAEAARKAEEEAAKAAAGGA
jgi:hypothetical protein